ncbi:MAG: 3-deoxy-D-manno-octulosonate 8-phosphate phosphatase [Flavobacteriales bacterium]|jgi:3-deoxy-D-manno-octulosonate 8-phosphate phosphatase (KDO 8-P phosphatase)|nr:3-deoxy-D-manno-octulosonate 8-phosphate phosphatase [Flavobacteriales bacterium]MBK8949679.1 3-deoxy-D-manno-octulosonate 8-phosphate phosphatase [Flavobacteriales bacterium]MBK9701539.1 3-deoxy-D-manno-octulosonate 8-phosphate phosphatase [Flavobacteriales bacterium]
MPAEPTYKERLAALDTFLFDVDGVFTDNRVLLMPGLDPVRTFHTRDAYAVQHAVREGLRIVIVTGGHSDGVVQSFQRLGVSEVHTRTRDKLELVERLITEQRLDPARSAYMGDDIPDLRVMQRVALACCPADAAEEVKAISHYVSRLPGGGGCVRDVLEQTLKVQGRWLTDGAHTW